MFNVDPQMHNRVMEAISRMHGMGTGDVVMEIEISAFINLTVAAMLGSTSRVLFNGPSKCQLISTITTMVATGSEADEAVGEFMATVWNKILERREQRGREAE